VCRTPSTTGHDGTNDGHDARNDDDDVKGGGGVLPIEVEVCNAANRNIGSRSLRVKAIGITPTAPLDDAGHANPGNLFRFDDGSYIFDLSTKNIAAGAYTLDFTIGNDPTIYHDPFTIRERSRRTPLEPGRGD
jgi:hypothetical protein